MGRKKNECCVMNTVEIDDWTERDLGGFEVIWVGDGEDLKYGDN